METESDSELLRRFEAAGDEKAFCRLVKRHASMVRGVALRCTEDVSLAEEVTQMVFTLLARKAPSVPAPHLAGWLHNTAFLTARNVRRKTARYRSALQQLTIHMTVTGSSSPSISSIGNVRWEDIRPHLDEALSRLPEKARHPVILRYFENQSIREIAAVTGKSSDAIRKELQRSLQRLSALLRRRGIFTTGPVLTAIIAGQNLCAPPASAAALAAAALQTAPSFTAFSLLCKTLRFMTASQSAKTAAGVLILMALLLPAWWFSLRGSHQEERPAMRKTAAVQPWNAADPDTAATPGKEVPEPEMKLARRGKLVQDRITGHWRLSHADMEDYLQRHGRDGEALALAFIMTNDADYLEEAIRDAENPSAALSFKCLSFPEKFTEENMTHLADLLGPDNPYPDILRIFLELKRGSPAALSRLSGISLDKPIQDPVTPIPGRELFLLAETGSMSLAEALQNSKGSNSLNGRAFNEIGDELYQGAKRAAAAGDLTGARTMLQQGALLAKQQESRWPLSGLANSSEAAMLDIANTLKINGVWNEPNEVVRRQLQDEELEHSALSETFETAIPAMSDEALRGWIPLAVSQGQNAMMRAIVQEEPLRSEYLKNEEKFRENRLRLAAQPLEK